eukprot:8355856-Alexandrium_andersonii.AAC.1
MPKYNTDESAVPTAPQGERSSSRASTRRKPWAEGFGTQRLGALCSGLRLQSPGLQLKGFPTSIVWWCPWAK